MDASYVPNNPQFGLQLECNWTTAGGSQSCQNSCQSSCQDEFSSCWPEDMGSFTLPLDLEPLPTLFPFSPCAGTNNNNNNNIVGTFKTEDISGSQHQSHHHQQQHQQATCNIQFPPSIVKDINGGKPIVGSADMADVLLSLKHAVVHPDQNERYSGGVPVGGGGGGGVGNVQPSVTPSTHHHHHHQVYHPHQVLLSPGGYAGALCAGDQGFPQQPAMFPSMSVNVSMNMTMHGYHPNTSYPAAAEISCPQVQWNSNPPSSMAGNYSTQGLLSPGYAGATYSFTADFRQPHHQEGPVISASYKPVSVSFASPRRKPSFSGGGSGGVSPSLDDDCQKPNVCRICGKSYARPSTLKTHLRTHSGEKPYRCIDCNKSFSQAANLTAHVRTHSGEKPFRCPVCDRRFSQSSSVTTHMRTHSGERPYRCRLCKKAFSDSSTLTKHLRIHSGEKPYECKLCLLRFSQSGNLNRHMRVHGNAAGAPGGPGIIPT